MKSDNDTLKLTNILPEEKPTSTHASGIEELINWHHKQASPSAGPPTACALILPLPPRSLPVTGNDRELTQTLDSARRPGRKLLRM